MNGEVFVSRFAAWAPGVESAADWREWARGERKIAQSPAGPALEFTAPLFRRRLSQVSKMTIQALHGIMPFGEGVKTAFVSFRGELCRQFEVNRMLALEGDPGPAVFSQSVFNTPPALAAIALGLRAGYTALYPGGNRFDTGFLTAAAPLLAGSAGEVALVYADELCPPEYASLCPRAPEPLAFAALLCAAGPGIPFAAGHAALAAPGDFLRFLWLNGENRC